MNRQTVTEFFHCVNSRDLDRFECLLHPEAVFYFPKARPLVTSPRIVRFFTILFRRYPRLTFRVHTVITEGHRAAAHWSNYGMNRRGEPYQNEGMTLLEMEGGRITSISDFFKDTEKF